jgi:hypothetical protein
MACSRLRQSGTNSPHTCIIDASVTLVSFENRAATAGAPCSGNPTEATPVGDLPQWIPCRDRSDSTISTRFRPPVRRR